MALFEPIFEALNRDDVRYVVVGGVAVVLHGYARLTADLDLAVDLDPVEARKAIDSLSRLGLRPSAPVEAIGFADPAIRAGWVADKGMAVFSLRDPADPMRQVDLFTESPIPFDELWSRSELVQLGGLAVRVASIPDLIDMKQSVGRPIDLRDVEELRAIAEEKGGADG